MGRASAGLLLLLVLLPAAAPGADAGGATERRLVSFDGAPPAAGSALGGARVLEAFPFARVALVEGAPAALARLASLPGVAGLYPEEPVRLLMEREREVVQAEAPAGAAWPAGANVTVAVVDSGIDATHAAFAGRVAASVRIGRGGATAPGDGDEDGHGTHVAGIVAGDGARSVDGRERGIAPAARVVAVDISDAFTTTTAVRAFAWIHENRATHDIRVVSNSWGREKEDAHYDPDDPVIRASDALVADGIVVVFSAGNRGRDGDATLTTEATNPNVLTVAAASAVGRVEPYSSRGPAVDAKGREVSWLKPDLAAPGTAVVSTRANAEGVDAPTEEQRWYTTMNGTSMAAPQVAAAAALLLDEHPHLSPGMVAGILTGTARDVGAPGPDAQTGHGMLSVASAVQAARALDGGEQRLVVERRERVHQEGSVAAAERVVLSARDKPSLPPAESVVLPLALPAGAAEVDLWFNWTGPGDFDVSLLGPEGERRFEPSSEGSLRLRRAAGEGAYRVVVRPVGLAAYAEFALDGSVLVREERPVDVAAELHQRDPFVPQGGFFVSQSTAERLLGMLGAAPALVAAVVTAVVAGGALALGVRRR